MTNGFDGAVRLLPPRLRQSAAPLLQRDRDCAEELRLRLGRVMTVLLPEGEIAAGSTPVAAQDLTGVLELATCASVHSAASSLASGFVTAPGGYRVGVCGSAVIRDGAVSGFREYSSLSIRIPHQVPDVSASVADGLFEAGRFQSTLLVSPPGCGKTTLLRDLVRHLSSGRNGLRTALCDERGEVAALYRGEPQLDVGERTDVLDGCPKAEAAMILLRAMNPQVLAMDEITSPADAAAIRQAAGCGVSLLATAHGGGMEELSTRPLYRDVLALGVFRRAVVIRREGTRRRYTVFHGDGLRWSER